MEGLKPTRETALSGTDGAGEVQKVTRTQRVKIWLRLVWRDHPRSPSTGSGATGEADVDLPVVAFCSRIEDGFENRAIGRATDPVGDWPQWMCFDLAISPDLVIKSQDLPCFGNYNRSRCLTM